LDGERGRSVPAWQAVAERFNEDTADLLMFHNPRHILFSEEIERL
jgi:hypothetical protein